MSEKAFVREKSTLYLRVPTPLHDRIRVAAVEERTSITKLCVDKLNNCFESLRNEPVPDGHT